MSPEEIELRVIGDDNKPKLTGYAAKFNSITDLSWFREKIKSGAFDDALKNSDVRCLKNHDPNLILGRTKSGTLRLDSNTIGLRFEADVPNTSTGKDTIEEIKRGDISGCSFAFTVAEDDWKYSDDKTVPPERTIIRVGKLFDVGPVTYPAYPDTTVAARSLEIFRDNKQTDNTPAQPIIIPFELTPEQKKKIERGYQKAGRIIDRNKPAEV